MSISGISSVASAASVASVAAVAQVQRKQAVGGESAAVAAPQSVQDTFTSDLVSMLDAVKGGDMTAAQTALTKLTADQPSLDAGYSIPSSSSASPAQTDLQSLFAAVKSGDVGAAQKALAALKSDAQPSADATPAKRAGHHHHHHHAAAKPVADESASTTAA